MAKPSKKPKKAKKVARPKKVANPKKVAKAKKINTLSQTHGQVEDNSPTTLDQIWGDDGLGRYGTFNEEEYKKHIDDLNRTDLQMHAAKIGLLPVDSRDQLTQRLMREFRKHCHQYTPNPQANPPLTDIPEDVLKILREGR